MKNLIKNIGKGIVAIVSGAVIGTAIVYGTMDFLSGSDVLTPQDFDNTRWIEFYNPEGTIKSDFYNNEKIPHSSANWGMYQDKVREKNKNKLEGTILLPDLDGDGKIGKDLNIKEGEK